MREVAEAVTRYPLQWPTGWQRTPAPRRKRAPFLSQRVQISAFTATQRLENEVDKLGAKDPTLSTNLALRRDGRPRSEGEPVDPGVALYFRFKGRATVLACDRFNRVADNIAAIAAHIESLRRIDRYGVGSLEQALAGYKALPADSAADWRAVFGFAQGEGVDVEEMQRRYKARARVAHPDAGGDDVAMAQLTRAREFALTELLGG